MNWHEYFTYDPETGNLIWKERPRSHFANDRSHKRGNTMYTNRVAGFVCLAYLLVEVRGVNRQTHRVIWEMHHGPIPKGIDIDHIDGNGRNNLIANLRLATRAENSINRRTRSDNTSGCKGVSWHSRDERWVAYISINKKFKELGRFKNYEDAVRARTEASAMHYGEFAREEGVRSPR